MRERGRARDKSRSPLRRSVAKSITWRIIGTLDTMLISWVVTGKLILAISIGSIELGTKMVLYVLHERAWERINWGLVTGTPTGEVAFANGSGREEGAISADVIADYSIDENKSR